MVIYHFSNNISQILSLGRNLCNSKHSFNCFFASHGFFSLIFQEYNKASQSFINQSSNKVIINLLLLFGYVFINTSINNFHLLDFSC
ncbi:hypothetical protein HOF65_03945 [bacterium]|nr:hypothetical protein [bacterium]MBT3853121.1 hypothetical protein [bacterium]MBT4633656.1 hypothetical protein [bacterium]MBT5492696.1 hypothetical protein [bacterium]MBT6778528.1 hypothetical protein [bacterium]